MKKTIALILVAIMLFAATTSLSGCGKEDNPNSFTWLLDKGEDQSYYSSYNQNPAVLYTLSKEYAGVKLDIDFKSMVSGSEKDQFNTMISTGEYYDVMSMVYSSYSASALNEMGIALDITDYVEKYMPNYLAYIKANPEVERVAYVKNADGEKRMYSLWSCTDEPKYNFEGYLYRRDWLVKYGKNPSTGEAFSGTKNADGTMTDNVKFPSWYSDSKYAVEYKANHSDWDGSDPIFISDWEWMFEIFDVARKDLGIADKGYNISMYYMGFQSTGDFFSGFGGGAPIWSYNAESGKIEFQATSNKMKAYLECLSTWYEKGWLDHEFEQRSADMFYKIDVSSVYAGYIGMWQGLRSALADSLESDAYPATKGIYVYGAKQPINDIYGDEECKGHEPDALYQSELASTEIIITDKAKDKNLEALFTYLDSLYEVNGENTVAKNLGLNKEQFEQISSMQEKVDGKTFQERFGIVDGSYTIEEKEGHDVWYVPVPVLISDNNLGNAAMGNRLFGLEMYKDKMNMPDAHYRFVNGCWGYYKNTAYISSATIALLSTEKGDTYTKTFNKINDKMAVEIPKFIKGTADLNGADWDTYAKTINKMGHEKITGYLQELYDSFN